MKKKKHFFPFFCRAPPSSRNSIERSSEWNASHGESPRSRPSAAAAAAAGGGSSFFLGENCFGCFFFFWGGGFFWAILFFFGGGGCFGQFCLFFLFVLDIFFFFWGGLVLGTFFLGGWFVLGMFFCGLFWASMLGDGCSCWGGARTQRFLRVNRWVSKIF